ncbi:MULTISPECIES: NAD(P)-binding protein [unclassified Amycolatopsis]|uniref:NAD(P)-binding protein n=1 Tax=unclassified Amycolatopsis TaxID=2618356 RepID=UPI00287556CF|nr:MULTISPECIES: NAD(P)-binding protein [unclassified Amycolatopsis]MDS0134690.1 NAD(P)-binding protein [Amycolatopsis sp. 505]MDS0147411.1 NAD(P)-binding protein [Amycolatopsis sp. CM201R]
MEHEKPFAITLDVGSSRANKTGAWRTERPVYVDLLPPCNQACPSGQDIQKWLYHAESGDYENAWRGIMADNPLPAVLGRICYRPCESACNRGQLDEAVGINSVERFLGDEGIEQGWTIPVAEPSGKRVLVVGAGPAGLSAAYHLARLGHAVTVRDAEAAPGGMMRYGIPRYRLPRDVIDAEIRRIADMGVVFEQNSRVTDVVAAKAGFDAVFLAVGAQVGKRAYIPAGDTAHVLDAISLLHEMEDGEPPLLGRRVAVYGGGNTAMDAARTAKRLGATDAVVVYRRTRDRTPAHESEVAEAVEEGVAMRWLSTISEIDGDGITVEKMRLDESGFPQPTGEFERLAADSVVLALGQDTDLSLVDELPDVERADGVVRVGRGMMTGHPGIFAGGDMVPSGRTATVAVGHGAKAAREIDAWLRNAVAPEPPARREATFDDLNTWYYSDADRTVRPHLDLSRRVSTFDEIKGGLDASTALFEARRCLSCGNCFECDNCYGVCPDNAVIKLEPGEKYAVDLDYCKGCGICVAECPCGAIEMVPEET